ncbi:MAG TPA: phenylalanine--tRNA ligase subunit beta [Candidatus Deferrimicrobiaceae bacterium]|nr:phenylalanine--tRNA ligase subunit beta [Candidatus Deferrimicrobiaceae bacterium]
MRVPLTWLAELVDLEFTPEQLAERLTMLGLEVQAIERRGADWSDVVVGELLTVAPHPRADRLSVTTVTIGRGESLEVVCGATNIAPGQRVPVALPGAVLPGGRRIERAEKMGVVSAGMLCSGDELGLTADADGILILDPTVELGRPLAELYGEAILDLDVKPNRGDALSIVGVAREVAATTGGEVRLPATDVAEDGRLVADLLAVDVEDARLCSRFVGRHVAGVTVGASPDRVQMRLLAAGIRPVSNVVDASNYVMVELGKPIHTFDAATVARDGDGRAGIVVRTARPGERIETLDHLVRDLDPDALLIADARGPLGIAGVMGGADSEVSGETRDVIIESAVFDPVSIRRTAFRYGLRSEASLRFEKGQEARLARLGADRTARLIREWAGGTVARGRVDTNPDEPAPRRVAFRPARVDRLLGTTLDPAVQRELLARVGIETATAEGPVTVPVAAGPTPEAVEAGAGEAIVATVPSWRRDIEIEADLAEEVARVHGYEAVPERRPSTPMPGWRPSPLAARDAIRGALIGAGVTEAVTYALVSPVLLRDYSWTVDLPPGAGEGTRAGTPITVTNPLSADHAMLRQALVGSLTEAVRGNVRRGVDDVALFEVGKGYGRVADGTTEWWRLGIALAGAFEPGAWNRPARAADVDDAKGLLELVARVIGCRPPAYAPLTGEPILHPGRSATVSAEDAAGRLAISGVVGELHPRLVEASELRVPRLVVAEVSVTGLGGGSPPAVEFVAPSRFPGVERDVAVVVAEAVPAADVAAVIRDAGGDELRSVVLFDVYRGQPLTADERSLAYRLRFEAADRTLTEGEVETAMTAITGAVTHRVGGRIRA